MKRASGILMHITSLPGDFGIGTFGKEAYEFVDFLVDTKQTYWQILPLTTTSYGDSPYQSFSAVAGNTNLIDFAKLVEAGYLSPDDFADVTFSHADNQVDYALLFEARRPILEKAVANFLASQDGAKALATFEKEQSSWLQDYAEFMSLKEHFGLKALQEWDDPKAIYRDEETLASYREKLAAAINYHKVVQLFFFTQWQDLKAYANAKGIAIIGDMPIYVSADSVEVWTQPKLFKLDEARRPVCIAGCPPDEFSDVGQLWGNPIYNWAYHAETGYKWWIYRIEESFKLYDYLRIDHFKGFSDFWEIPAGEETAVNGQWVSGPNIDLFNAVKKELGELPIIAEDLGYIDDKAKKLLADAAFPGMKILEFGFFDVTGQSIDIPHVYTQNSVAYVGTHDNEVANGWYDNLDKEQQDFVDSYTNRKDGESVTQMMLRELFSTVSNTAIASMQDVLDLPAESRMNIPNTLGGNWVWRMTKDDLKQEHKDYLLKITELYTRGNENDN